ncbi:MAG: holo-ACP synthase [Elusimicrobia bacterium]|nr:holo-ACP synthase [Elusimicrobiota bacterium]
MTAKKTNFAVAGLGVDLAEVKRVRRLAANQRFLARVFTPGELAYAGSSRNRFERLAARFAVKEAVIKALDDTSIPLKDIAVENTASGSPKVAVKGRRCSLLVSISHTATHALAAVIAFR